MDLTSPSPDRVQWVKQLDGHTYRLIAREIRRERTGVHAVLTVGVDGANLATDNINIGRLAEREKVVRSAYAYLEPELKQQYPQLNAYHDIAIFCERLPTYWEEQRHQVEYYLPGQDVPPLRFVLKPYLLEDGLTILFCGPGAGKSYLSMWIGIQVAQGRSDIWTIPEPRYVLYINLERPPQTIKRRFLTMLGSMGIDSVVQMEFFHAVGLGLSSISRKLMSIHQKYPECLFILDSLSRTAMGKLVDDDTGNRTVDTIRAIGGTWLAIGHTSRAGVENQGESHLFGGIMQDCGADVMVRMVNDQGENKVGIGLDIPKANDIARSHKAEYLALEFRETPDGIGAFQQIRRADRYEFPELEAAKGTSILDRIKNYLEDVGEATPTQIADACGLQRPNVYVYLKGDAFRFVRRDGKNSYYGLNVPEGRV